MRRQRPLIATTASTVATRGVTHGIGSSLNLDLCQGATEVIDRLRYVNPKVIDNVTLEYNLMSELVFDQDWMAIFQAMGSLPMVHTVSLSFRVPVPIPVQAFAELIRLSATSALVTLHLNGLQLSTAIVQTSFTTVTTTSSTSSSFEVDPMETLLHAFQRHTSLQTVHICRYRPIRRAATQQMSDEKWKENFIVDPLCRAIFRLPKVSTLYLEKTDIFSDPNLLHSICQGSYTTLKLGDQERGFVLDRYIPFMAASLESNQKLHEVRVHHPLEGKAVVAAAFHLLERNASLTTLFLRIQSNDFGAFLGAGLQQNTTLQTLELDLMVDRRHVRKNLESMVLCWGKNHDTAVSKLKLDARGIRSAALLQDPFAKMLKEDNFVLRRLMINRDTMPLKQDLLFFLKLNQMERNYFLRRQPEMNEENDGSSSKSSRGKKDIREKWIHLLIQNKSDVRVLHYFISRNPWVLPI